jgi:hypothetical protein
MRRSFGLYLRPTDDRLVWLGFRKTGGLHHAVRQVGHTLDCALASSGIVPVPDDILQAHKRAEIVKHPPSFFYRHPDLQWRILLGSFVAMVANFAVLTIAPDGTPLVMWAALLAMVCAVVMTKFALFVSVLGPAEWIEHRRVYRPNLLHHDFVTMPDPLRRVIARLHETDPTIEYNIGILEQQTTVLDPYVLACHVDPDTGMTTTACLGIWDGADIIEIAQTR